MKPEPKPKHMHKGHTLVNGELYRDPSNAARAVKEAFDARIPMSMSCSAKTLKLILPYLKNLGEGRRIFDA